MDWARIASSAYWVAFTVVFLLVAVWESWRPERQCRVSAGKRWMMHAVLTFVGAVLRMGVIGLSPVAAALSAPGNSWSPFPKLPLWAGVIGTVLLLDLGKYASHRLFHAIPWLWRIHRVHHSDPDFDVSTGLRFHPLEAFLPMGIDLGLILLLAPPVEGVVLALLLVVALNFFQHANANLPLAWERGLRAWLVTPRMHRIHHSEEMQDQQSNFGELFPWWDRFAGTYREEPTAGKLVVGLAGYQDERSVGLVEMVLQPFRASREPPGDL